MTPRRPSPPRPAPALDPAARLLHRDDRVLVLDKPAGLPVHRGPRGGPSIEDWLPALAFGKRRLPQPAHRLDTDTAGCLVLGRTKPALAELGALFAAGRAAKTYWAVVRGAPPEAEGMLDAPLLKRSTARQGWWMAVDPSGQPARTAWKVLGRGDGLTWLELHPATGRTHQIRVHCAHLGCPILGDPRYGTPPGEAAGRGGGAGPLHLLARTIALPLDPPVAATAPPPPHMRAALAACGWREAA
ncbi:RluA family pseudouridine synthase [Paracraurococcus lichenis]|uniref:RluA family pseudouridine synthase n=1 Tax=Paracraurococcus lichenis TaxID=3064888 RepID=A0ABT9DZ26_9PROT|nr:RluA family pseudouridine synthase [Paracraurococcus sp. LOR1-02]MDO9709160.1 RluA family pseudouridine synthase [Paracraurococcus sp. LOR1-02]